MSPAKGLFAGLNFSETKMRHASVYDLERPGVWMY
jgi:hypothetical protein